MQINLTLTDAILGSPEGKAFLEAATANEKASAAYYETKIGKHLDADRRSRDLDIREEELKSREAAVIKAAGASDAQSRIEDRRAPVGSG